MSRTAKGSTKLEDRLGADVLARLQSMAHEFGTYTCDPRAQLCRPYARDPYLPPPSRAGVGVLFGADGKF